MSQCVSQRRRIFTMFFAIFIGWIYLCGHPNSTLISLDFFNQLFTSFKLNPNALISTLVTLYSEDPSQDFLFKKWTMTHLSIRCVQDIITLMKKPMFLVKALEQLKTLPVIPMKKVNPDDYNKTHLSQLSKNEFCNTAWVSFDGRKRQELVHGDR